MIPISGLGSLSRSSASQPFWSGLDSGRLLLPWCEACEAPFFYPRRWCPQCHGDAIRWREAPGRGIVWAHSTVYTEFDPDVPVPYVALLIDLEEGVRIGGVLHDPSAPVYVGDPVAVNWSKRAPSGLPTWQLWRCGGTALGHHADGDEARRDREGS